MVCVICAPRIVYVVAHLSHADAAKVRVRDDGESAQTIYYYISRHAAARSYKQSVSAYQKHRELFFFSFGF